MGKPLSPEMAADIAYNYYASASKSLESFQASAPSLDELMNDGVLRHSTASRRTRLVQDLEESARILSLASTVCARHKLASDLLLSEPVEMNNLPL